MRRLWAARFTSTASPTRSSACCLRGSLIPMPASSCGFRIRPMPQPEFLQHHDYHQSQVVARLRPDVSLASALAQVGAVQYQLHLQYPHDPVAEDVASRSLNEDLAGNVKKPLKRHAERGRLHAADRLPERRESAGCAGRSTAEGSGDSQRSRSAACHFDSRAVDRERADLRGRWPGRHSAVGTCHALARACVERPAHRARHPHRWYCDRVRVRADVRRGAGRRLAARALDNGQDDDESPADFRAHGSEQRFAHGAAQVSAHGGDWNHGGLAGCRGAAAQELSAAALGRCGLRDRKHAHAELRPAGEEIRHAGEDERVQ